jgi:hypothetical protein
MKDFNKIDWHTFNRPPFFPQWLCRGETEGLASFGDVGLAKIDDAILAQKDKWDLATVTGEQLDRIGKLLDVERNGEGDDYYRLLLKLKILINTNTASVNDIIKVIKFYYSSEIVEIRPNYPAGITILHDGDRPPIDFNRIMAQVVGAGIGYDTRELFAFKDNVNISDHFVLGNIDVKRFFDSFNQAIRFNGRVKHDGRTVNPTEILGIPADGTYKFDGSETHKPRLVYGRTPVRIPIKPRRGIADRFSMSTGFDFSDILTTRLRHQGTINAVGSRKFDGVTNFGEALVVGMRVTRKHDGTYKANGKIKFNSRVLINV